MKEKTIKKGTIVVVQEGRAFGCPPSTITKVLSKPGRIHDELAITLGFFHAKIPSHIVMCLNLKSFNTCNNKPASYEFIADLKPANESEKKLFKSNNNQPVTL